MSTTSRKRPEPGQPEENAAAAAATPDATADAADDPAPAVTADRTADTVPAAVGGCVRFNRLLSVLSKSLVHSREKIARDASEIIKECYGELTTLFASSEDGDGVSSLVDLLLAKLDSVHDRFGSGFGAGEHSGPSSSPTRLEEILGRRDILPVLRKVESVIDQVDREEREFEQAEKADKASATEAIKTARATRMSPSGKKRRVLPAEAIGYHAHRLKLEYKQSLEEELKDIEGENEKLETELNDKWNEWQSGLEDLKNSLKVMEDIGGGDSTR